MKYFLSALIVGVVALTAVFGIQMTEHSKSPILGSATSPDISSPYFSVGGVQTWRSGTALIQNASTTCSLQSPAATSTLRAAGIMFTTASSTSMLVDMGQSANPFSTTTAIGTSFTVAAGAQALILASTSPSAALASIIFPPNTYFNIKIGAGSTGSLPVGSCHADWEAWYPQ